MRIRVRDICALLRCSHATCLWWKQHIVESPISLAEDERAVYSAVSLWKLCCVTRLSCSTVRFYSPGLSTLRSVLCGLIHRRVVSANRGLVIKSAFVAWYELENNMSTNLSMNLCSCICVRMCVWFSRVSVGWDKRAVISVSNLRSLTPDRGVWMIHKKGPQTDRINRLERKREEIRKAEVAVERTRDGREKDEWEPRKWKEERRRG